MTAWARTARAARGAVTVGALVVAARGTARAAGAAPGSGPIPIGVERTRAAVDCPSAAALAARVNQIARGDAVVAAQPGELPGVMVTLDRDGEGYRARIEAFAPVTGVRVITDPGPSCAGLGSAVAVTLALLLDATPDPAARPAAPAAPAPAAPAGPAEGPARSPSPREEARRPRSSQRGEARADATHVGEAAGLGVALGMTFDVAPAAWFGARVTHEPWRAELVGLLLPRQDRAVETVSLSLGLWGGRARGCRRLWRAEGLPIDLGACAEAALGALKASATPVDQATTQVATWLGVGGGLELGARIWGPLTLGASATALGPVLDERFRIRGQPDLLHDPPRIAGLAGLTLGVTVW